MSRARCRPALSAALLVLALAGCSDPAGGRAPQAGPASADPAGTTDPAGPSVAAGPSDAPTAGPAAPRPEPTVSQTPVAPPAGEGDLEPVPTAAVVTLPPTPLDEPADMGPGLQVRLTGLRPVQVTGRGPGQVSGAAVAVTVRLDNTGGETLEVDGLAVSLGYAGTEAGPVDGRPADPLSGPVGAGETVTGTYVFVVPEDQRDQVTVRVVVPLQPVAVFTGNATG